MENKDLVRLEHMLDSARAIQAYIKGKRRGSLDTNRMLISSIIRELEIIGEAAAKVTKETQNQFSELPWKNIIGMRNQLIHVYFDINNDIVWKTIKEALPLLCTQLEHIITNFKQRKG